MFKFKLFVVFIPVSSIEQIEILNMLEKPFCSLPRMMIILSIIMMR